MKPKPNRHAKTITYMRKLDRLIAKLTRLVELTPGNRKFTYRVRLQQALSAQARVKRSMSKGPSPGRTVYLVGPSSVRFVSGGAPGSKR